MAVVTLDLWHTLVYLPPEDEETYMVHQIALGTEVLRAAPRRPGAREHTVEELAHAFEEEYNRAVVESAEGRTVTPADQISRAGDRTGRRVDPKEYLERLKSEVEHTPFRRAPGALTLLKELRSQGYRLGMVSNTIGEPGAFLRPILAQMGFERFVDRFVFSDELPWAKPAPEIFRYALEQLGGRPEQAVHVGDGWADLEGARRAGFRGTVLFTGLHSYGDRYRKLFRPGAGDSTPANYRTDRLREVAPLVRKLLPPG